VERFDHRGAQLAERRVERTDTSPIRAAT